MATVNPLLISPNYYELVFYFHLFLGASDNITFCLHYLYKHNELQLWYTKQNLRMICRLGIIFATIGLLNLGYHSTIQVLLNPRKYNIYCLINLNCVYISKVLSIFENMKKLFFTDKYLLNFLSFNCCCFISLHINTIFILCQPYFPLPVAELL